MVMLHTRLRVLPALLALVLGSGRWAVAQEWLLRDPNVPDPAAVGLTVTGSSGGLIIPHGRTLADGSAAFGGSNFLDPNFSRASRGENYLFTMGVLPYVEISGRLTNFGDSHGSMLTNNVVQRDLSANFKLAIPRVFDYQPDIALGINDLGGAATNYRSKYLVASQPVGPVYASLGYARGQTSVRNGHPLLDGLFGGAELSLWSSGFSLLAERSAGVNWAGVRYASPAFTRLANMQVVGTVLRTFGARDPNNREFDRTTVGVNLVIPFGDNARTYKVPPRAPEAVAFANLPMPVPADAYANDVAGSAPSTAAPPEQTKVNPPTATTPATTSLPSLQTTAHPQSLQALQTALEKAGLERVRVGMAGSRLVIEYENHRYNRNEVDAIGIALGLGARLAPESARRIQVVTKKAGLALYATSVDRAGFRRFLANADAYEVLAGMQSEMRPLEDPGVEWLQAAEGPRGWSRILVQPVVTTLVGTEYGLFDYSVGVSTVAFVPLWKGAEASVDYLAHVGDSENVRNGPFLNRQLRSGVRSALLSQSLWLGPNLLNVISIGRLQYDYDAVQNELTFFVPGRDDQVRLEYSRLKYSDPFFQQVRVAASASYRLQVQPLELWVEAGYNQYAGNDRGPSLRFGRWFGDLEAQAYIRRSNLATFAGFQLAFPLTPRQGMRPGITHIEGTGRFNYALETRVVSRGSANLVAGGATEEIPIAYSARNLLLNRGRVGEDYMLSQLPRMREAALLFSPLQ